MRLFRVARCASTASYVATTLVQVVVVWGLALGLVPWLIHTATTRFDLAPVPFRGHRILGLGLFAAASAGGLVSGFVMAVVGRGTPLPLQTARELVVCGPYRHVRNPMAICGISQGIGVGIFLADGFVIAYACAGALLWHTTARVAEERDLEARFGDAYRRYRDAVPLWLPRWRRRWQGAPGLLDGDREHRVG